MITKLYFNIHIQNNSLNAYGAWHPNNLNQSKQPKSQRLGMYFYRYSNIFVKWKALIPNVDTFEVLCLQQWILYCPDSHTHTDFSCFSLLPPESLFDTLQKMYLSHLGQGQTMHKVRYTLGQLIFKQIIYKSEEMVSAQVKHGFVLKFRYKCHPRSFESGPVRKPAQLISISAE